ncbi:MAG: beta-N-acetylhexosaminidase [Gammaproteobacteria bacterium]
MQLGPFLIDLEGQHLSTAEKSLIKHPMVGGIIFFTKNIGSDKASFKGLASEIKSINPDLLLLVDQEGGAIQRFKGSAFGDWPDAFSFGKLYDKDANAALNKVYDMGREIASLLKSLYIDINLAPVLDLHTDNAIIGKYRRAFHKDPHIIAELAKAFIDGSHSMNVLCCGKHFPGHGACLEDSHIHQSQANIDSESLKQHIYPFKELISTQKLDCIMPAHVLYPQFDPKYIAGFSKYWMQTVLREELGFEKVIMSDCLSMAGAQLGSISEAAITALNAGCDLVILCEQNRKELTHILNNLLDYDWTLESKNRVLTLKE